METISACIRLFRIIQFRCKNTSSYVPGGKDGNYTMSAIDKIISQLPIGKEAASKKEEYIDKIIQVTDKLTEAQVKYIYHLISQLFCQTAD